MAEPMKVFDQNTCLKTPVISCSGEKSFVDELSQNTVRYDNRSLSTIEVNQIFVSSQKKKTGSVELLLDSDHSLNRSTAEIHPYIFRTYGCGVCDKIFDVEDEFMEHCHHHYSENSPKNTFEEFFELRLVSYFP